MESTNTPGSNHRSGSGNNPADGNKGEEAGKNARQLSPGGSSGRTYDKSHYGTDESPNEGESDRQGGAQFPGGHQSMER